MFRDLKAEEIDVRIGSFKEGKGASLLLYKNARSDMDNLDETVGALNWKREHTRDNKNCIVSIWDEVKAQWISKEDTGTESNAEKEKGLASDSFKRACFNWGIGRELYTAPFIWVNKCNKYEKFTVKDIKIENKKIIDLSIIDSGGKQVFKMGYSGAKKASKPVEKKVATMNRVEMIDAITKVLNTEIKLKKVLNHYNVPAIREMTEDQLKECCRMLKIVWTVIEGEGDFDPIQAGYDSGILY